MPSDEYVFSRLSTTISNVAATLSSKIIIDAHLQDVLVQATSSQQKSEPDQHDTGHIRTAATSPTQSIFQEPSPESHPSLNEVLLILITGL
jgi:hypothetical protein